MCPCCRGRHHRNGQDADDSLYFMVLDVVEESGGRFNIMGKTEAEQSILVQVHDSEPYFYMGQPVFKARPQLQPHHCCKRTTPFGRLWKALHPWQVMRQHRICPSA